jgi:hypothetical protein
VGERQLESGQGMDRAGWRNYWTAQMELAAVRDRRDMVTQAWGRRSTRQKLEEDMQRCADCSLIVYLRLPSSAS